MTGPQTGTGFVGAEVLATGAFASVQDAGRPGLRRIGVPTAGALDRRLLRLANALVGNDPDGPAVEFFEGGLHVVVRGDSLRVAIAGDAEVEHERAGDRSDVAPWRSVTLRGGDRLRVRRLGERRVGVLAIGGLAVPSVLGSASTDARARLGGIDGRPLAPGDILVARPASQGRDAVLTEPPGDDRRAIRAVAGPQADHFTPTALERFVAADYTVTADADRMGVRLEGPPLEHRDAAEIVTDATLPGSVQVPGSRQPIVLLADGQTAGGYPKIATVIGADLGRLAARRPGDIVRFALVDAVEGERLARVAEAATAALIAAIEPVPGVAESALYDRNLVTGVVDAEAPEP